MTGSETRTRCIGRQCRLLTSVRRPTQASVGATGFTIYISRETAVRWETFHHVSQRRALARRTHYRPQQHRLHGCAGCSRRKAAEHGRPRASPNVTPFGSAHHALANFTTKRLLKFGQVRQRPIYSPLSYRMRISNHHQPLHLEASRITPRLSPAQEESLLGCQSVHDRRPRFARERFHISSKRDPRARQVPD
jgi:hypothetical protein